MWKKCLPGSTTDLGQSELDTPDLTLVLQTILANELQLGVTTQWMSVGMHLRRKQRQAAAQWPVNTDRRAASKGL